MSHFYGLVILPEGSKADGDLEPVISELVADYSENKEVPPYSRKCHCWGDAASAAASEHANATARPIADFRKAYHAILPEFRPKWEEFTADWRKAYASIYASHPLKDSPDPKCSDCEATGYYESTRNPKARWDWWTIGGRWTGVLSDYNPENDPANYETCFLCVGTGMRNDQLGMQARAENPAYTCNGCGGKGQRLKFASQWPDIGNREQIANIDIDKVMPHAIITPSGEWHEAGEMGWFAVVHDEKPENDWKEEVTRLLKQYPDHVGVVVDFHI